MNLTLAVITLHKTYKNDLNQAEEFLKYRTGDLDLADWNGHYSIRGKGALLDKIQKLHIKCFKLDLLWLCNSKSLTLKWFCVLQGATRKSKMITSLSFSFEFQQSDFSFSRGGSELLY